MPNIPQRKPKGSQKVDFSKKGRFFGNNINEDEIITPPQPIEENNEEKPIISDSKTENLHVGINNSKEVKNTPTEVVNTNIEELIVEEDIHIEDTPTKDDIKTEENIDTETPDKENIVTKQHIVTSADGHINGLDIFDLAKVKKPTIVDRNYTLSKIIINKLTNFAAQKGVSRNLFITEVIKIGIRDELQNINANTQLTSSIGRAKKVSFKIRLPEEFDKALDKHKRRIENETGEEKIISKSEILNILLGKMIEKFNS